MTTVRLLLASTTVRLLIAATVAFTGTGCAQAVLLGYLVGGPPSIEPDFDAETGLSLSAPETTVAVICYAPTDLKWDFEKIDQEVSQAVSYLLGQNHISVIHPDSVRAWIDEHPDYERPEEVGAAFECDYVVDIEINDFSLYEHNSTTLYRGRTEAFIHVVQMDEQHIDGERIYTKEVDSVFPTRIPRSTEDQTFSSFKREYLSRMAEEIGWLFYDHFNGDKIPYAT